MLSPELNVWLGAFLLSFAPVFVKLLPELGPTAVGFYRCLLASVILLPLIRQKPRLEPTVARKFFWLIVAAGFVFAVDLFVWHRSVLMAGAGIGTILGNTQVFYLTAFALLAHGERLSGAFLATVAAAAVGAYLLVNPSATTEGHRYWVGVAFGLATGVVYATYVALLHAIERLEVSSIELRLFGVSLSTAIFLALFCAAEGHLPWPHGMAWLWLALLAAGVQVGGWFFIQRHLRRVPVSRVGLLLLTQPLGATIWGMVLFGEVLRPSQWIGGALTLGAIYMGGVKGKKKEELEELPL